jgi:hypothetical protein
VYEVEALGAELPSVTLRDVICAAEVMLGIKADPSNAKADATASADLFSLCFDISFFSF